MVFNRFYSGNAVDILSTLDVEIVDLTVTSLPYENLRDYKGFSFNANQALSSIYRVTKKGGVCVWVVGDKINEGKSLVSFEHALIARQCGFVVHDVMIYQKKNTPFMRANAYTNCYEFMFVLSKGKPKTFNPIKVPTKRNVWRRLYSTKNRMRSTGKGMWN